MVAPRSARRGTRIVSSPGQAVGRPGAATTFRRFIAAFPGRPVTRVVVDPPALFAELTEIYDASWASAEGPRIEALRARPSAARDPALARGDELELFRPHHENDYSNWLAWLLSETNTDAATLQRAVLAALCPDRDGPCTFRVMREVVAYEGHVGHEGRLDLLLLSEQHRSLVAVEVKTRHPGLEELLKNAGYARWLAARWPGWTRELVLLVPDAGVVPPGAPPEFRNASWGQIARSLRAILEDTSLGERSRLLVELFVSAIEGHVLDLPVFTWRRILRERHRPVHGIEARAMSLGGYVEHLEAVP
jgi:hypothetical protein